MCDKIEIDVDALVAAIKDIRYIDEFANLNSNVGYCYKYSVKLADMRSVSRRCSSAYSFLTSCLSEDDLELFRIKFSSC